MMSEGLLTFEESCSQTLKHLGLVSRSVDILKIVEKIDEKIPMDRKRNQGVTRGQIVKALIINILGFVEQRLYLVSDFFKDLPVEKLLGDNVTAEKLNDDIIGRTLDTIYKYGIRRLMTEISIEIISEYPTIKKILHLDTTSISVEGEYQDQLTDMMGSEIKIRHGYSKDKRPDLKQFTYALATIGSCNLPVSADVLPGNSSDKKSLIELANYVKQFSEEVYGDNCGYIFVADSALYNNKTLLNKDLHISWITRIPKTYARAKDLLQMKVEEWEKLDDNYSMMATPIREDTNERWVLIFSKDAYDRDVKTLNKNLVKKEKLIKKAVAKMEKEIFHCEKDASKAIAKLGKDHPLFNLWPIEMIPIYAKKDKNKKGIPKRLLGYGLKIGITKKEGAITKLKDECGKFILGTNVSKDKLPDDKILGTYKEQSKVESCFRFLKNPSFFASDIYLKKVGRIEALMLVVTLAIMTYNVMEFFIREMLKETGETFPNQVGKKINNPTLRWVFQCFKSINISSTGEVTNMRMHLAIIVSFFGEGTMALYGIRGHPPVCKLVLK